MSCPILSTFLKLLGKIVSAIAEYKGSRKLNANGDILEVSAYPGHTLEPFIVDFLGRCNTNKTVFIHLPGIQNSSFLLCCHGNGKF